MLPSPYGWISVCIVLFLFAAFSYRKQSLDAKGASIGFVVGLLSYYFGGIYSLLVMLVFFVVADSCTRIARKKLGERSEKRTTGNILGNSGAAIIALALGQWAGFAQIAFSGAMATALSDTVSSEIGMLSKKKPRLITSLKREVEMGTDGGVTMLGIVSGAVGALVIGVIYYAAFGNPLMAGIITFAGFMGCIMDSVLGAALERRGVLTNTYVNFFASLTGAIIAFALSQIIA